MSMTTRRCKMCKKLHKPKPEKMINKDTFCDTCTLKKVESVSSRDSFSDETDSDEETIDLSSLWRKKPFIEMSESETNDEESSEEEDRCHTVDQLWNINEYYNVNGVTLILSPLVLTTEKEDSSAAQLTTDIPKEELNIRGEKNDCQEQKEGLS